MPYCLPSPPSSPTTHLLSLSAHDDNDKTPLRNHRRSRSTPISFSTEKSPGAFAPLAGLPQRKHSLPPTLPDRDSTPSPIRRAQFSIKTSEDEDESSSSEEEDSVEEDQEVTKIVRGLSLNIDGSYRSTSPKLPSPIPFPQLPGSAPSSPTHTLPPILPKVASNPIILANGKPLKPSLKSASAPHLPDELKPLHLRAASAPSTPISHPKNVHFKDEKDGSLETIRVFNKGGRPANLNYSSGNDETETEGELENSNSFPFPSTSSELTYRLADAPLTSAIPAATHPASANVYLESITVPASRPPVLRGSILVRNITFAKLVAVRFTFDDWQTTSEITGHYVTSLPSLPPPFASSGKDSEPTSPNWDWATSATQNALWDRFSFSIKLEDVERKLLEKTMFLAVRYNAQGPGGGEWWDNNDGLNYKVTFRTHSKKAMEWPRPIPAFKPKVNDMFGVGSSSPSFPPSVRPKLSSIAGTSLSQRPGMPLRSHSNPTVPTFLTLGQMNRTPKSRLRLSNYIAPSSLHEEDDEREDDRRSIQGRPSITPTDFLVTPPIPIIRGLPPVPASSKSLEPPPLPTPTASPGPSPNSSAIFTDSQLTSEPNEANDSYSQLVKKFCFHQSTPSVGTQSTSTLKEPWHESYGGQQHTMLMSL